MSLSTTLLAFVAGAFGVRTKNAGASGSSTVGWPERWFLDWAIGEESKSGVRVTPESAMGNAAVWACVRVRSEDVAKLPCILYRRLAGGGKKREVDHPLYSIVRDAPNPRQTAFEFKQQMQIEVDLRGNALAIKQFDGRGRVVALWPTPWKRVTVLISEDGTEVFYRVLDARGQIIDTFPADGVMHLRGLSLDGYVGLSPIAQHRETIGLAMAAQRYGAAFFGNSAQPRGGIEVPSLLSKEASDALRSSWEERHKGPDNANKIAIFDGGMKWVQTAMNNADAQYIEARGFQDSEIWRIFRMPPHKVADLEKATFSNIEQQALEYVTDCLMSEFVRWEQTLARDLLLPEERGEYFFEFLIDALLRGDFKSRMDGYAIARNWGLMSADDCRDKENMNPLPDGKGQIYLQPLNMIEAGTKPPPPSAAGTKELIARLQIELARMETTNA